MTEPLAWLVAACAAVATLFGLWVLTRPMRSGFLKYWLRTVAAVLLLLPAPVPGFDTYYAPAILVAVFEAALQRDGQPALAASLVFAGVVAATVLVGGYCYWRGRRRARIARGNRTADGAMQQVPDSAAGRRQFGPYGDPVRTP